MREPAQPLPDLFGFSDAVGPKYTCGCPCVKAAIQRDDWTTRYVARCPAHDEPAALPRGGTTS